MQTIVDEAPKAKWYFSDGLDVYASLWYHFGRYAVSEGKTDTFSVEADNAELRHYLARSLSLFLALSLCLSLCCSPVCFLFQSAPIEETSLSKIYLSHYRLRSHTYLATP